MRLQGPLRPFPLVLDVNRLPSSASVLSLQSRPASPLSLPSPSLFDALSLPTQLGSFYLRLRPHYYPLHAHSIPGVRHLQPNLLLRSCSCILRPRPPNHPEPRSSPRSQPPSSSSDPTPALGAPRFSSRPQFSSLSTPSSRSSVPQSQPAAPPKTPVASPKNPILAPKVSLINSAARTWSSGQWPRSQGLLGAPSECCGSCRRALFSSPELLGLGPELGPSRREM